MGSAVLKGPKGELFLRKKPSVSTFLLRGSRGLRGWRQGLRQEGLRGRG